jgi:hypothetical protein
MARMVRAVEYYPAGEGTLPPMPDVAKELQGRYPEARIETFSGIKKKHFEIPKRTRLPHPFKHLLRYDAESVFWYLFWCCVQAQPAGKLSGDNIHSGIWSDLTSPPPLDRRDSLIARFPMHFLHPAYSELEPLLESMSEHLQGDLFFATDGRRKADEYLHEAFQRLILNFLSANATKPFMDTPKHKQPRGVDGNPMGRTDKSTGRRTREEYEGAPVNSVSAHDSWSKLSAHIASS